jgi:hypothetical protein
MSWLKNWASPPALVRGTKAQLKTYRFWAKLSGSHAMRKLFVLSRHYTRMDLPRPWSFLAAKFKPLRKSLFPWRSSLTAKKTRFHGGFCTQLRKFIIFLAVSTNRQGNWSFSWRFVEPSRKLVIFLALF